MTDSIQLRQLNFYPVKSLRGITVDSWPLTPLGLQYDRHWMLVNKKGRFITQRQLPAMALIDTALEDEGDEPRLLLSRSGKGGVEIPLSAATGDVQQAQIWRDTAEVREASVEASNWLTEALESPQPLKLVRMLDGARRSQSQAERFGADTRVQFPDAAPFLIANSASLDALNLHLQSQDLPSVDMRRFRPNLVIEGLPAFAEHKLTELQLGKLSFTMVDHCERCVITTINPDTAEKDMNMATYRALAEINPMPDNPASPAFAVNATLKKLPPDNPRLTIS